MIEWRLVARFALLAILCACVLDAAHAATKHRARAAARATAATAASLERTPTGGPARMIEIEPGVFVSTFDCISDDGRGHIRFEQYPRAGGGGASGAGGSGM